MTRPLRILHLTAGSDAGGISRYLLELCPALRAMGHEVAVAGERGVWHDAFEQTDIHWIDAPLNGGYFALRRCARMLRDHPCDVIHAHYRRAALVGRMLRRPLLFTLHLTGIALTPWHRMLSDFGDHAHAPSQAARRWLIDDAKLPEDRITLIPHGVDARKFPLATEDDRHNARQQLGIEPNATVAAYVGRFDEPKNEQWIVDVAEQCPEVTVLMQGQGPREQALRDRVRGDNVRLLDYGDPLAVYQACDALLLPSSLEGFSLVCAEAMSVGRPVLRTQTAGTEELIIENQTGRSVPIDHDAFVVAAGAFLADRDDLKRMGAAAATHIRDNCSFDRQLQQTAALYQRMR